MITKLHLEIANEIFKKHATLEYQVNSQVLLNELALINTKLGETG